MNDVRRLLDRAAAAGGVIRRTRRHWQILCPGGGIVVCPLTPSDSRSLRNTEAQLRRAGLNLRGGT